MAIAETTSAQVHLLDATSVHAEVDISPGLHAFSLVGLPDKAVEEAKDRVAAAIKNSGFTSPKQQNQKVVVSLAPAHIKKEGPVFDLAIALGYLIAAEEIEVSVERRVFAGELALDGSIRSVAGALSIARHARDQGFQELYIPAGNEREAAVIDGITVYPVRDLPELIRHLTDEAPLSPADRPELTSLAGAPQAAVDMSEIKGQHGAKRGLAIAAAGGHNAAMTGPPGTGKSMLAKAFAGILPPLTFEEMLEVTGIHSAAGEASGELICERPFRAPHHTSSYASVIGGGNNLAPGEVTLAHRGVLFLDEFPEFDRRVVESLRQPLEEKRIRISRSAGSRDFPADVIAVTAMNPCPCGNYNVDGKRCSCSAYEVQRYQRKISGPIADRMDVWLRVEQIDHESLSSHDPGAEEGSDVISERVSGARRRAAQRNPAGKPNGALSAREIRDHATITDEADRTLTTSAKHYDLSARSYYKVLKLARTIADLEDEEYVGEGHVAEALQYRPKDNF